MVKSDYLFQAYFDKLHKPMAQTTKNALIFAGHAFARQ
jgi:hypothetical protein